MLPEIRDDGRPIVFVSDAHLGSRDGRADREDRLIDLLREIRGEVAALFILGDLFDFWFEYRHAIPKGTFRIARAIAEVVDSGVPTAYFGGNHDFWVGTYLAQELGLQVYLEPVTLTLQGRRVHLAHGDGLGPGDTGYKLLKRILRARWAIAGYRSIHPDIGVPLARWVSAFSHKHTQAREVILARLLRDVAGPRLRGGVSAMLMGHVHETAHYRDGARDFILCGDWMDNLTHVRMQHGSFTLLRLEADGSHRPLASEPFPASAAAPKM